MLIAIEHSENFAEKCKAELRSRGLAQYAEVRLASIEDWKEADDCWPWYGLASIEDLNGIDLLVVDGPPRSTGALARYPALPLLYRKMRPGGIVLLDDADRTEEKAIAELWRKSFPNDHFELLVTTRGALKIIKRSENLQCSGKN